MDVPFAELLGKSSFSFLEGASAPDALVERAKALGLAAIGVVDRDGLYGSVRAHVAGKKVGQRVITGAEIAIEPRGARLPSPPPPGSASIALLCADADGYANLCRILTEAHADHEKGSAGIPIDRVADLAAG